MTYDNINIASACFSMAKKWDCECWVTENIIHFGHCRSGDAVDFEIGKNVRKCHDQESVTYATRIYAFGSTKNIPSDYRPVDETVVLNGVVQKRLMLPEGTPYIVTYRYDHREPLNKWLSSMISIPEGRHDVRHYHQGIH